MKEISKRNANPTVFGFEFQSLVALMVMLEYLKEFDKFSVEGPREDIELELFDGMYIYVQTKAKEDPLEEKSNRDKFSAGLVTLNEDILRNDAKKIIYASNTYNPLGNNKDSRKYWLRDSFKSKYKAIEIQSKKFENILKGTSDIRKENLEIYFYRFLNVSDEDTKYEVFYKEIEEYLVRNIGRSYSKFYREVYDAWYTFIRKSESSREEYSKHDFLWKLVICLSSRKTEDEEKFLDYFDIEDDYYEALLTDFEGIINDTSNRFEFSNSVLNDFEEQKLNFPNRKTRILDFIKSQWKNYARDVIPIECPEKEDIVKIVLWKVLKDKRLIKKIKESGNI